MKKINKPPRYKSGIASELEWQSPSGKIYTVYHSFRSYSIGLGMRMFVKIGDQWYELDGKEIRDEILW